MLVRALPATLIGGRRSQGLGLVGLGAVPAARGVKWMENVTTKWVPVKNAMNTLIATVITVTGNSSVLAKAKASTMVAHVLLIVIARVVAAPKVSNALTSLALVGLAAWLAQQMTASLA